jgi:hypothetical protein
MKKTLLIAALGGLFAATVAQAQVSVYVCGSTAFRSNAYRAIRSMYDGGAPTSQNTAGSANNSGAGQMTFQGTITPLFGAQTVTIFCDWTGSAQGTHSVAATPGDSLPFLANATQGDTTIVNHTADLAFSDVFQLTTGFSGGSYAALSDEQVAIQPFVWCRSINASSSITNITMQQLKFALQGSCPLSFLTGRTNDYNLDTNGNTIVSNTVYFTGRNKDSGSRLISLSDVQYSGSVTMYESTNGTAWNKMTISQIVNGVNYGPGFSSGGIEASTFYTTAPASAGSGVGYIAYADARTVVGNGGQIITYNGGLPFNGWAGTTNGFDHPDWTPVTTGKYSMWGPEHLFINPSGANFANAFPVWTNLVSFIDADIASTVPNTVIRLSQMGNTSRQSDGGKISP